MNIYESIYTKLLTERNKYHYILSLLHGNIKSYNKKSKFLSINNSLWRLNKNYRLYEKTK